MRTPEIFEYLKVLSTEEHKEFCVQIATAESVLALYNTYMGFYPSFENPLAIQQQAKELLEWTPSNISSVTNRLKKSIQLFMSWRQLQIDDSLRLRALLTYLGTNQASKLFQKEKRALSKLSAVSNEFTLWNLYSIKVSEAALLQEKTKRNSSEIIDELEQALDLAYWGSKLRYRSEKINRLSLDEVVKEAKAVLSQIPNQTKQSLKKDIIGECQILYLEAAATPDPIHLMDELLAKTTSLLGQISETQLREYIGRVGGLCTKYDSQGYDGYEAIFLESKKFMDENNLLLLDGAMNMREYMGICESALREGDIEYAEYFTEKYSHHCFKDADSISYHFNLANIAIYKNDSDKALSELAKYYQSGNQEQLHYLRLSIKAHFLANDYIEVKRLCKKVYNSTLLKKRTPHIARSFKNWTKFLERMNEFRFDPNQGKPKLEVLKKDLEIGSYPISDKRWLLATINTLIN